MCGFWPMAQKTQLYSIQQSEIRTIPFVYTIYIYFFFKKTRYEIQQFDP